MLEENEDTIYKLNSVSETISGLSESYKEAAATIVGKNEIEQEGSKQKEMFLDYMIEEMEDKTQNMLYEDIVNQDSGILDDIYNAVIEKDEIHLQDIVDIFEKHNSFIVGMDNENIKKNVETDISEIVKIANESWKIVKLNLAIKMQKKDAQNTISAELHSISRAISSMAENISNKSNEKYEKVKEQIEILLLQKDIGIYDISIFEQKNGRVTVEMYTKKKDDITDEVNKTQKIEEILTKVLKQKMILQKQKNNLGKDGDETLQTYTSEDKMKITVSIAGKTKENSEESGDNTLKLKLDDGKMLIALSDGMGSGKEANKASDIVIKTIKKYMNAGFEKEVALDLINTNLMAKAQNETFASLDLGIFDLYEGSLELIKNCACPTFIKNGKNVKKIHAISLPTGILSNVDSVIFDTDIKPGDIVVMCSDGVLEANMEAIDKEEAFSDFLKNIKIENTKKIADIILEEAIDKSFGHIKDDMTVIVAKINN